MWLKLFITALLANECFPAQYPWIIEGRCRDYSKILNHGVDLKKLEGTWHEYAGYVYPLNGLCVSGNYTLIDDRTFNLTYEAFMPDVDDWRITYAKATFRDPAVSPEYTVEIDERCRGTPSITPMSSPTYITAVDYDHYFISWSCVYMEHTDDHIEMCAILTRKKLIDPEDEPLRQKILTEFKKHETAKPEGIIISDQWNCSKYQHYRY